MRSTPLWAALLLLGCSRTNPPVMPYDFTRGEDVVRAMHDRYVNRWFTNVTYSQHTEGQPVQLYAVDPPDRLRIDIDPREQGNGALNLRDTTYIMQGGRVAQQFPFVPLDMLLQHGVYWYPPPQTIQRLRQWGFDLARVREDTWDNRRVFVVGGNGKEFWVDRELMLVVRLVEPTSGRPGDTRFIQYERVGPAWLARRIQHVAGDRVVSSSELRQIGANLELDSLLFVPSEYMRARHWYQTPLRQRR